MDTTTVYEYRVDTVDDNTGMVDTEMAKWAAAGWELVSGSSSSWVNGDMTRNIWHTRYVMYWRKPRNQ
jgi:hypothetical protein